jgi:hypothetical protein
MYICMCLSVRVHDCIPRDPARSRLLDGEPVAWRAGSVDRLHCFSFGGGGEERQLPDMGGPASPGYRLEAMYVRAPRFSSPQALITSWMDHAWTPRSCSRRRILNTHATTSTCKVRAPRIDAKRSAFSSHERAKDFERGKSDARKQPNYYSIYSITATTDP